MSPPIAVVIIIATVACVTLIFCVGYCITRCRKYSIEN